MSRDDPQSGSADASDDELSVGGRLRAAREAQPLTLSQIAAELRIEQDFLVALEDDRLDEFPAPVFAKGYLKQYGGLLGLDESDLLAQYYRQVDVHEVPVMQYKPIRLRDEDQIRHWLAAGVVLVLLIGGLVAWWLSRPEAEPVPFERTEGLLEEPPPIGTPVETVAVPPAVTLPEAVEEPDSARVVIGPAVEQSGSEQPAAGQSTVALEDPAAGVTVQVEVNFLEDCWTEISDARGERLFYGLGSAGARSRFGAQLPISIFLGNASGVELTVNGESYPVPAGSRQGNLARFVIADSGV
jgi:cytoskeleton protein RodZ